MSLGTAIVIIGIIHFTNDAKNTNMVSFRSFLPMTNTSTIAETNLSVREYPVHAALAPFVKCIWSQESDRVLFNSGRERILPDSCVELVIHFRDRSKPILRTVQALYSLRDLSSDR